jgi:hypothetical protein
MFFISYATLLDLVIFMELFFRWIKIGLAKIIMGVQEHSGGIVHRLRSGHRFLWEPRAARRVDPGALFKGYTSKMVCGPGNHQHSRRIPDKVKTGLFPFSRTKGYLRTDPPSKRE